MFEFRNISKSFQGVQAVRDVSFVLDYGRVLGVVGENGAGKSTMMNILGGVIQPDAGEMILAGNSFSPSSPADASSNGVAFIHQELNLFSNLSVTDNLFIDRFPRQKSSPFIDYRSARQLTSEMLALVGLKISPDTPVDKLSPGERQQVEIARALSKDAQIIIFDEPTTSLTNRETEHLFKLIEKLKREQKSVIYISHVLEDVLTLADDILVLRDGEVVKQAPSEAFTVSRIIAKMVGRDLEQLYPSKKNESTREPVLEVHELSKRGIIHRINFGLHKGEVVGIFGLMGSGRTELARILFGLELADEGEIRIQDVPVHSLPVQERISRGMAFVTEDRRHEGLLMDASILENMSLVSLPQFAKSPLRFIEQTRIANAVKDITEALHVKAGKAERQPVKTLSGGNQQKVVIGKWLLTNPAVFILDEPTRGIDVGARYEVYSIVTDLADQGAGILCISSEIEELIGIADRILVMHRGEITGRFSSDEFDRKQILHAAFGEAERT